MHAWETPEPLKKRWAQLFDGIDPEKQVFPLEPYVRSAANVLDKSATKD